MRDISINIVTHCFSLLLLGTKFVKKWILNKTKDNSVVCFVQNMPGLWRNMWKYETRVWMVSCCWCAKSQLILRQQFFSWTNKNPLNWGNSWTSKPRDNWPTDKQDKHWFEFEHYRLPGFYSLLQQTKVKQFLKDNRSRIEFKLNWFVWMALRVGAAVLRYPSDKTKPRSMNRWIVRNKTLVLSRNQNEPNQTRTREPHCGWWAAGSLCPSDPDLLRHKSPPPIYPTHHTEQIISSHIFPPIHIFSFLSDA